jgi:hypothetical protein
MGFSMRIAIDSESLLCSADTTRSSEPDTGDSPWWTGYVRGLRRATKGENFGTQAEHELLIAAADSADASRSAIGNGYKAGLLQLFS